MQTDQVVILHNEAELHNFMKAAVTLFSEKAASLQPPAPSAHPSTIRSSTLTSIPRPDSISPKTTTGKLRPSTAKSVELPQIRQTIAAQEESHESPSFLSHSINYFEETSAQVPPTPLQDDSREGLYVGLHDFVRIPLVVDVWMTRCGSNVDLSRFMQPRHFAGGFVVWSILHHYFPRDAQLSAFHEPQTRLQYAEIWSQVDLILQKHGLVRIPVEIIGAVMEYRQAGQAVLLMTLYETLTNLKLTHPIPQIHNPCRKKNKCNVWKFQDETLSNTAKRAASFEQVLQRMYSTNQRMAFCKAQRSLRPPRLNRQDESRTDIDMGVTEKEVEQSRLQRLMRGPHGDRCYLYHADKSELVVQHHEREVSNLVSHTPKLARLDGPPFFNTDPLTKCHRVPVREQLPEELATHAHTVTNSRPTAHLIKKEKLPTILPMHNSSSRQKKPSKTREEKAAKKKLNRATPKLKRRTPEEPVRISSSKIETKALTESLPAVQKAKSKSTVNIGKQPDKSETVLQEPSVLLKGPPFFSTDPLEKVPRVAVTNQGEVSDNSNDDGNNEKQTAEQVFLRSPFFNSDPLHKTPRANISSKSTGAQAELQKPFFDKDPLTKQPRVGVAFKGKESAIEQNEPVWLKTPFFDKDALHKTPRVPVQNSKENKPKFADDQSGVQVNKPRSDLVSNGPAERKVSSLRLTVLQPPYYTTDPLSQSRRSVTDIPPGSVPTVKLQQPFYTKDPLSKTSRVPVERIATGDCTSVESASVSSARLQTPFFITSPLNKVSRVNVEQQLVKSSTEITPKFLLQKPFFVTDALHKTARINVC